VCGVCVGGMTVLGGTHCVVMEPSHFLEVDNVIEKYQSKTGPKS